MASSNLTRQSPIFIIGSPRSGTTWLQLQISSHPKVATTVEFPIFENYIYPLFQIWNTEKSSSLVLNKNNTIIKGSLPLVWTEKKFQHFLVNFVNDTYSAILKQKKDSQVFLDKDPQNTHYLDLIHQLFPHAKFIHIIRDGRDVAASQVSAHKHIPGLFTKPDFNIIDAASMWQRFTSEGLAAKKFGPDNYLEVRYEDLLENNHQVLKGIFKFCHLKISDHEISQIINANTFTKIKKNQKSPAAHHLSHPSFYRRGTSNSWQTDLSLIDKILFAWTTNQLLLKLGYETNNLWYRHPKFLYYLCWPFAQFKIKTHTY